VALYNGCFKDGKCITAKLRNANLVTVTPPDFEDDKGFINVLQCVNFLVAGPLKLVSTKDIPPMREIVSLYDFLPEDVLAPPKLTQTQKRLVDALIRDDTSDEEKEGQSKAEGRSSLEVKENMPHTNPEDEEGIGPDEPKVTRASDGQHDEEDSMSDNEQAAEALKKGHNVILNEEEFNDDANSQILCQHYPSCSLPGTLRIVLPLSLFPKPTFSHGFR
jgi:hypothetical protein